MAPKLVKQKIASNMGAPYAARFYNQIWSYRLGQLTTSNVRAMRDSPISLTLDANNNGKKKDEGKENNAPVRSDLQPHALHTFRGDEHPSIVVAVPKSSEHYRNIIDCQKGSLMVGHTDPQLFHWFKQLGTLPPRSVVSGPMEVITGDLRDEVWESTFTKHPIIHSIAEDMWVKNQSKTSEEETYINQRIKDEDDKRMRRMSSSDWRAKFQDRERNPTPAEDEELPVYVVKPDTFAVIKLTPEVRLWTNFCGEINRVYDPVIPPRDVLARSSARFTRMLNVGRAKLVSSLNINYNLKLTNAFIFEIDCRGMWAMGTQESPMGENGQAREQWTELRIEFGKDQVMKNEQDMEWWIRGLQRLGAPEMAQTNASTDEANMNPEDYDFRHL
ncbi:Hypothetical protein, putative [Bodo saltans]|uniref:Uncharacterized protein n=1 Tax=Bodo saltans TaxID=75058 RepID=A0A0S4IKX2_BODSA|nr:Hypothetical protein, putative [Bodo saltans]|eukprot:CUE69580.1 Hypothetical protein, putative [Bodo saltans]